MVPNPTTEMSKKVLAFTETNMKAAFDHARKLVHAKDMQEAIQIQTEFLKSQYAAATEQLKEMGNSIRSSASDASKATIPTIK
jgi:phasin